VSDIDQHTSDSTPRPVNTLGPHRSPLSRWIKDVLIPNVPRALRSELAGFIRLVREDLAAHDGDWSRPGFQALLVYRFGVWRMSIRSRLWRAPFSLSSRALFAAVRNLYGIEIPFSASIGRRVVFEHQHGIVVHGNTVIGDDCIIRQGVTLGIRRLDRLTEAPVLGRGVNVGAGAKILGRVIVGDYAEIGANAVVLEDVPPYTLAVGVPAHNVTRHSGLAPRRERSAAKAERNAANGERGRSNIVELTSDQAPRSSPANTNGSSSPFMHRSRSGVGNSRRRTHQPS
jgi:serine O-acetyltransferase